MPNACYRYNAGNDETTTQVLTVGQFQHNEMYERCVGGGGGEDNGEWNVLRIGMYLECWR